MIDPNTGISMYESGKPWVFLFSFYTILIAKDVHRDDYIYPFAKKFSSALKPSMPIFFLVLLLKASKETYFLVIEHHTNNFC